MNNINLQPNLISDHICRLLNVHNAEMSQNQYNNTYQTPTLVLMAVMSLKWYSIIICEISI